MVPALSPRRCEPAHPNAPSGPLWRNMVKIGLSWIVCRIWRLLPRVGHRREHPAHADKAGQHPTDALALAKRQPAFDLLKPLARPARALHRPCPRRAQTRHPRRVIARAGVAVSPCARICHPGRTRRRRRAKIHAAPSKSNSSRQANSGASPIRSASCPIASEKISPLVQPAIPTRPLALAMSDADLVSNC